MTTDDAAPPTHVRYGVVAFTLSLIAVAYLDRVCISTAAPVMKRDLGLSDEQMGFVFSAFTLSYALFEIPSGWFADRYGARKTITRIVVWWSVLTALTGMATGFASLVLIRLLFGMGEAGTFPATGRVYAKWLAPVSRGGAFGLAIMAGALSGALTQPLVVLLMERIGWHMTFVVFGLVGIVWAMVWWWWFRDDPAQHSAVNPAELAAIRQWNVSAADPSGTNETPGHPQVPWVKMFRNRTMIALCGMYFAAIYGWYFYLTWLPTYLLEARGFDLKQAGQLAALPYLGIALGVFLGGWFSDLLTRSFSVRNARRTPGLIGLPLAACAIVGAIQTPTPEHSAILLAAAAGLAAMGVAPAWAVCLEIGGEISGVVSGAMNMFGNLGGTLSPVVIGFAISRLHSWDAPLYSVAVFYLIAAACWLAIDPTRRIELNQPQMHTDTRG